MDIKKLRMNNIRFFSGYSGWTLDQLNNEIKENIDLFINSNFDLEKINSLYSNLSSLTIWELYKLKKDYVDLGYSSIEINTQIQKIISFPLYVALMTIIATIVITTSNNKVYDGCIIIALFSSVVPPLEDQPAMGVVARVSRWEFNTVKESDCML